MNKNSTGLQPVPSFSCNSFSISLSLESKNSNMNVAKLFDDVAEALAKIDPEKILELRAPNEMAERVEELVDKKKEGTISEEEATELEHYLALDLFINLTKARARRLLAA